MKNNFLLISFLYFIFYVSLSFPLFGIVIWYLIDCKVIKTNFDGSLLVPISLFLTFVVLFIEGKLNKRYAKNIDSYLLFKENKHPKICKYNCVNETSFFNEFERYKKNKYIPFNNDLFLRCYFTKSKKFIKGYGFINYSEIANYNEEQLKEYLKVVFDNINNKKSWSTDFVVCAFCDNLSDNDKIKFIKFYGFMTGIITTDGLDTYHHTLNFCIIEMSTNRIYYHKKDIMENNKPFYTRIKKDFQI